MKGSRTILRKKGVRACLFGLGLLLSAASGPASALDVIMRPRQDAAKGRELDLPGALIEEALRRTEKQYGAYQFAEREPVFSRERMLEEIILGEAVNLTAVATQPSWEEKLLVIRIPVDMGLSGLRIALIRRDRQPEFSAIRELGQLKQLRPGVGVAWSSRKVLESNAFPVVTGENYEALLKTLLAGRSDFFPRGLNEAFPEFDSRRVDYPELAIESDLLFESPLPTYFFVSPTAPRLAKRLEEGMESMVKDGTLLKLVMKMNGELLARARLCSRRVFYIPNPTLSEATPLKRRELWFDPWNPSTGLCKRERNSPPPSRP